MTQHIEEARKLEPEWRYEIKYGPEGEANYAWLYRGNDMVATMKTHHAVAIAAALAAAEDRGRIKERERLSHEKGTPRFNAVCARAEAAEARAAELEKRLADAEREPKDEVDEGPHQFVTDWHRPARCQACGGLRDHPLHRAARAYMEGK